LRCRLEHCRPWIAESEQSAGQRERTDSGRHLGRPAKSFCFAVGFSFGS
jgi:hypothetical protein